MSSEPGKGEFSLSTPWLKLKSRIGLTELPHLKRLKARLSQSKSPADRADVAHVSAFFSKFSDYPVSYLLPRGSKEMRAAVASAEKETVMKSFDHSSPHVVLTAALPQSEQAHSLLLQGHWDWNVDEIIELSQVPGESRVDPTTVLTCVRRQTLLSSLLKNKTKDIYEKLGEIVEAEPVLHKQVVAEIVRQNHYVTERCREVLSPAIEGAGEAAPLVKDFIRAEQGHDLILERCLTSLGFRPGEIPVRAELVSLMDLFKVAAETDFLAFCMIVDLFERNSYRKTDPLAAVMLKGGYDGAARYIEKHKGINDTGGHENMALTLLGHSPAYSRDAATGAIRTAELASMLMYQAFERIYGERF